MSAKNASTNHRKPFPLTETVKQFEEVGIKSASLTNLIALSKDDRNSDVSSDMMGELLMLQDVACVLEESRARDLSF